MCSRDDALLERHIQRLKALSKEHDLALYQALGDVLYGILLARRGQADGVESFERGIGAFMTMGVRLFTPYYVIEYAAALIGLQRLAEARRQVGLAQALMATTGQRWAEAEIYRVEGDVCLAEGHPSAATARWLRAIEVARSQQARSWELRAAWSIARQGLNAGDLGRARNLLRTVYDWFREGFETPDLRQAKALLDQLG